MKKLYSKGEEIMIQDLLTNNTRNAEHSRSQNYEKYIGKVGETGNVCVCAFLCEVNG